jgi:hypothetical protein
MPADDLKNRTQRHAVTCMPMRVAFENLNSPHDHVAGPSKASGGTSSSLGGRSSETEKPRSELVTPVNNKRFSVH